MKVVVRFANERPFSIRLRSKRRPLKSARCFVIVAGHSAAVTIRSDSSFLLFRQFMSEPEYPGRSFETTHWSMIVAAGQSDTSRSAVAMQQLCERYWFPLYAFVRRRGYDEHRAQDLIQDFFLRVIEKGVVAAADPHRGRFRTFLLKSLENFVANESAKATTLRRGGSRTTWSLDLRDAEGRLAHQAVDEMTPEAEFNRRWALQVLDRVLQQLESEFAAEGKADEFEALRPYLSTDSQRLPYASVAEQRGISAGSVKVAVHRMRRKYRNRLEAEIIDTLASPDEVEQEIHALFKALS